MMTRNSIGVLLLVAVCFGGVCITGCGLFTSSTAPSTVPATTSGTTTTAPAGSSIFSSANVAAIENAVSGYIDAHPGKYTDIEKSFLNTVTTSLASGNFSFAGTASELIVAAVNYYVAQQSTKTSKSLTGTSVNPATLELAQSIIEKTKNTP